MSFYQPKQDRSRSCATNVLTFLEISKNTFLEISKAQLYHTWAAHDRNMSLKLLLHFDNNCIFRASCYSYRNVKIQLPQLNYFSYVYFSIFTIKFEVCLLLVFILFFTILVFHMPPLYLFRTPTLCVVRRGAPLYALCRRRSVFLQYAHWSAATQATNEYRVFSKYPNFIRLRLKITFYIFLQILNDISVTTLAWHRFALRWRQGIDLNIRYYLSTLQVKRRRRSRSGRSLRKQLVEDNRTFYRNNILTLR